MDAFSPMPARRPSTTKRIAEMDDTVAPIPLSAPSRISQAILCVRGVVTRAYGSVGPGARHLPITAGAGDAGIAHPLRTRTGRKPGHFE